MNPALGYLMMGLREGDTYRWRFNVEGLCGRLSGIARGAQARNLRGDRCSCAALTQITSPSLRRNRARFPPVRW